MRLSLGLSQQLEQRLELSLPPIQWSLLQAYRSGRAGPPPFVPPTFEEEAFEPQLKLERQMIPGFDSLSHGDRMRLVDEANAVFRFAYTRGIDEDGREKGYFKIPLLRNRAITEDPDGIDEIKRRITRAQYERATAVLRAVGEMERIARAIPYHGLYKAVSAHLKKDHGVGIEDIVLISIDRGGRIPCLILQHALGLTSIESLKVDQGGGRLDEDKLREFERSGILSGKHALFVDSTVDSGRQIRVLEQYFESAGWKTLLRHRSWSIVGSNEYAGNFKPYHRHLEWGVDPDGTFEDEPELMGIDYAPGDQTKVIERPTEASEAIRACLFSVPAGIIYDAADIDEQIANQREEWLRRRNKRRTKHEQQVEAARTEHQQEVETFEKEQADLKLGDEAEREWTRITSTKKWRDAAAQPSVISFEELPSIIPNGASHQLHNVLVIGSGRNADIPQQVADLIADTLGPHHSLFAGTQNGNPGIVLTTVLQRIPKPEVRLYQPSYQQGRTNESFGGTPVVFVGEEKDEMRLRMVKDSQIALVLGGASGTLREVLLSLKFGKPVVLIKGWGAIPAYLLGSKKFSASPHLKPCDNLAGALQTVMDMTRA